MPCTMKSVRTFLLQEGAILLFAIRNGKSESRVFTDTVKVGQAFAIRWAGEA